jgi:propanediol dehydratase large subunit
MQLDSRLEFPPSQAAMDYRAALEKLIDAQRRFTRQQTILDVYRSLRRKGFDDAAERVLEWGDA